jgi:hypothetical protein
MELRVERMESVIAPNAVVKAITDFVRGFIAGFLA